MMELSVENLLLSTSLLLTGLCAGLFIGWSVSVIPGTQKVDDLSYLSTMQRINREILNPGFFIIFLGSVIALGLSTYYIYPISTEGFCMLLMATLMYLLGTMGVTGMGNVPLNNELDMLKLAELTSQEIAEFRQYYESRWNRFHTYRMFFSALSFIITLMAHNIQFKN